MNLSSQAGSWIVKPVMLANDCNVAISDPVIEIDCFNIYDQNECTWNPTGGFIGEGGCEVNP